jgi:hypothetical protein
MGKAARALAFGSQPLLATHYAAMSFHAEIWRRRLSASD